MWRIERALIFRSQVDPGSFYISIWVLVFSVDNTIFKSLRLDRF